MIKAVLFDLDNTLIDFMRMKKASVNAAVEAMIAAGVRLNKEEATKTLYEIYDQYGIEYQEIFQLFLKKTHKKVDYRILASGIVAYRKVQMRFIEPYANVIPTLLNLKIAGLKLGIVSDAPRLRAWLRLVEMRLHDFFDAVVCFEDTRKLKPNRLPFATALNKLKVTANQCVMVGDWPERDIKGAKQIGMKTIFARYGSVKDIKNSGADFDISNVADIPAIIKKLNKK